MAKAPYIAPEKVRSKSITVRFSESELQVLERRAQKLHMPLRTYLREAALKGEVKAAEQMYGALF